MSRTSSRRARKSRRIVAALCLSLAALLCAVATADACSWDYLIWMPHSNDADPLYRFIRDGKAGYIDRTGKVVIEPKLKAYGNYGGEFHDGLLEVGVSSGGYVDTTGKSVEPGLYRGWQFSEGLAAALKEDDGKWGYVDRSGKFAISPRFEGYPNGYVSSFSGGFAWIRASERYGFINHTGEFVVAPTFLHADDFHDGMARIIVEGPCAYVNEEPCPDFRVLGGSQKFDDVPSCKFTFVDTRGTVLEARFDAAKAFSEGLAPIMKGGKWGYIDKSGKIVIEPRFDDAAAFTYGRALVKQDGLYGFIDRRGELVIPPRFKYAESFSDGLAAVGTLYFEEPAGIYYIGRDGRTVIPGPFHIASHFFKGLAHVELKRLTKEKDGERWCCTRRFAYIDAKGKTVFTYQFDEEH